METETATGAEKPQNPSKGPPALWLDRDLIRGLWAS